MTWLPLAGWLGLLATAAASVPFTEPDSQEFELLDLAAERYERMTVAVTIMDEGPFHFIVDTGAQATVVSHAVAERLRLGGRQSATLVGINSSRPVETAVIPRLTLGSRTFSIASAPLIEPLHIGAADGILGLDSLQHQRVLLDFRESSIAVADAETNGRAGYEIVVRARRKLGQLIITRARIDGVRTAVIIDTGAQGSIGNMALDRRLRRSRELGNSHMTDINGVQRSGLVRIARSLEIGDVQIGNVPIIFTDSPTFTALGLDGEPAMLLGMSELRLFNRVAIDFSSREVLFDLPREALRPALTRPGRL